MRRAFISLLRQLTLLGWRDISSAPFDCTIELAVINATQHRLGFPCLRHGDSWFDATTMRPLAVSPTHWRYWQPEVLPMSCC
ncbi:hypothetical protein [Bradyrhizobium jicamae]|uniref:hypothetical protein n=1 Tax=Bradyrhizobium jicamae TaxID=280332 RepID=UPI002012018E|nr:hypothetical protein [Bradyrhizobium jicamae]